MWCSALACLLLTLWQDNTFVIIETVWQGSGGVVVSGESSSPHLACVSVTALPFESCVLLLPDKCLKMLIIISVGVTAGGG